MATLKKAKVTTNADEGKLTWHWADETENTVSIDDLGDVLHYAALHGLKQKLSDSYAGATTVREAQQAFNAVMEALLAGTWNAGRSSSGGIWVEALARAAQVSIDEALEKWNGMDEEQQKELKKHPGIKQAKAEIELERATAKAAGTTIDLSDI